MDRCLHTLFFSASHLFGPVLTGYLLAWSQKTPSNRNCLPNRGLRDDQYRLFSRLQAVKGKSLGRKALMELTTIGTPDTTVRWHRKLVAQKWDYSQRRKSAGRPRVEAEIDALVLRFARESPSWGYDRIQDALANLGHEVSDQTVGNILKKHGIEPSEEVGRCEGVNQCHERLGSLLRYYYHDAV